MTDFIEELRQKCAETSQRKVAKMLLKEDGTPYSHVTVSQILGGYYGGDIALVKASFNRTFNHEIVDCPMRGEISATKCLEWRKKPFASTNSMRVEMYRACRICPQNKERPA